MQTKPAKSTLGKRCVVGGDPLGSACNAYDEGIAIAKDGTFYVTVGKQIRRYTRADGADCKLEPAGDPIETPPDNPRWQSLDSKSKVYMRSGGAEWHLVRAGDAMYAYDFLGGLFRVDHGKAEPACVDVYGYKTLAPLGKKLVIAREGLEEIKPGKKCTAASLGIDAKARGELYAIGDKLYLADGKDLTRYDGKTPVSLTLEKGKDHVCYASALSGCGDGVCVLDQNCMQIIQLDADGNVLRFIDGDALFPTRPFGANALVAADSGNLYVRVQHRDKTNDKEICESAIYELPAALFAH